MKFNNVSDYEKLIADKVTKVECGDKTFYVRVAGPLNFNLIETMGNKDLTQEDRGVKALCACLCDDKGVSLFDANNEAHLNIIRGFGHEEVTPLMNAIWVFFSKKKE